MTKTNPSARELACYDKSKSRVRYSSTYVNTNDGRSWSVPNKNFLGVDAHFVNASLDGQRTKSRDWLIEIYANFDGVNGFLFNSAALSDKMSLSRARRFRSLA